MMQASLYNGIHDLCSPSAVNPRMYTVSVIIVLNATYAGAVNVPMFAIYHVFVRSRYRWDHESET